MLLFFSTIILIMMSILILIFSEVRLVIDNLELSNSDEKLLLEYNGRVCIYFIGKIKLLCFKMNNNKTKRILEKDFVKEKVKKIKNINKHHKKIQKEIIKKVIQQIKEKSKIRTFKFQMYMDTKDVIITSYLIAILSTFIPNFIKDNLEKFNKSNYKFEIFPLYKNQNYIYLKLNSIISIKVVHIISMFKEMGGIKNERTSNRRLNVNCYGKH